MIDEIAFKGMVLKNYEKKTVQEICILAEGYMFGYGEVEKDSYMAFRLYEIAARKNSKIAKFNMANMCIQGDGTPKDVKRAVKLFEELVQAKDVNAMGRLAYLYYDGKHVERNIGKAIKLYKQAAQLGANAAAFALARIYDEGEVVEQDLTQTLKYYEMAAKRGCADSLCNLGYMHEQGRGVERDYNKAIEYYEKAADLGSSIAQYNLGCAYIRGAIVEKDYNKGLSYIIKSAENKDPQAYYELGYLYLKGYGVEQNYEKAMEYFTLAMKENVPDSYYILGYMNHTGIGTNVNYQQALYYYNKAAELGYIEAYCDIGFMYNKGRGVEQDVNKAIEYYSKGVELGDNGSKCNLAVSYVNGEGVEKNIDKAIEILESIEDETFVNKYYYLGTIKHDYTHSFERTKEIVEQAVAYYEKYLENLPKAEDQRYQPFVHYKLTECYMELYYIEQSNGNRNREQFLQISAYRDKAKEHLKLAKTEYFDTDDYDFEIFEKDLAIAEDLLNDESLDLSKYTYEEFKKQFFGKHDNLFLLTRKKEFEIFDEGIKFYFNKREKDQEIQQKTSLAEQNFNQRKSLIRKRLEEMNVEDIDQKLEEIRLKQIQSVTNQDNIDFSTAVIGIDKYLEEILHYIFVDSMYEHKQELLKTLIENNINEIKTLLTDCSQETLKELNYILNGINKSVDLKNDILLKKLEIFAERFQKNWNWKNIANDQMQNLGTYFEEEKENLNENDTRLISKMLENSKARDELSTIAKSEHFELGNLFYMAFSETGIDGMPMSHKMVDPEFVEFVKYLNKDMDQNEASLKLNELLIKIEMFRTIVRNVASHKHPLSQNAVEHGINISIVQENSIFKLLDELFGEYLNKKYVENAINSIEM